MVSLFIDTTSSNLIISILKDNKLVEKKRLESVRTHNLYTLEIIDTLLKNNNYDLHDINKIYVASGPGSFTGTRVGISIAKTIAYSLNIDIYPVSSLMLPIFNYNNYDFYITKLKDNSINSYIGIYDKNYNLVEETIINNNDFDNYIEKYSNSILIENIYDYNIEKAIGVLKNNTCNVHKVNPNYIKEVI